MIIKFNALITIDLKGEKPTGEREWESFNIDLERMMQIALENQSDYSIGTAEVTLEEIE